MARYLATIRGRKSKTRIGNVPVYAANRAEARRNLRRDWFGCHVLNLRLSRPKPDYYAFERRWARIHRPAS